MITLRINGADRQLDVDADTPLLWALREGAGLTGTKYGCGVAACGACTVHVDGQAVRSCAVAAGDMGGAEIVTIEGLQAPAVRQAWIEIQVPQCGYCQSGMIMATAALLQRNPRPTDADIDEAVTNLCRCGTYPRIRRAIRALAEQA